MAFKGSGEDRSLYVAVILYESSSEALHYTPLYQESFVLIEARSLEQAQGKALAHAETESASYLNDRGETISWALKQIVDVNSVLDDRLEDGAELYVRHFHNYGAYRQIENLLREDGQSQIRKDTLDG